MFQIRVQNQLRTIMRDSCVTDVLSAVIVQKNDLCSLSITFTKFSIPPATKPKEISIPFASYAEASYARDLVKMGSADILPFKTRTSTSQTAAPEFIRK